MEESASLGVDHYALDANATAGGVVMFDYNNDGFEDLFLTGGDLPAKLYRNNGGTSFSDVTEAVGLANLLNQVHTVGGVVGDINNDGYRDLLVTTSRDFPCVLLLNQSGERFEDISRGAGITQKSWSTSAAMADYDLDGDLDIYVANYVTYNGIPFEENIVEAEADFFYRNLGDLRFETLRSPANEPGCTLVAAFSDYDCDGDSDLFVLNDFGDFYQPNQLYRNETNASFSNVSEPSGMRAAINSMGIAAGDINGDTYLDYYISDIGNNPFYLNRRNGQLANVADDYALNDGKGFSWGAVFLDMDNDTDLDLFVSKGSTLAAFDPQFNRLYRNQGGGDFEDVSVLERVDNQDRARGVAIGDLNNDGHVDLVVAGMRVAEDNSGRALIYINRGGAPGAWLNLQLQGSTSNRDAIGSMITAYVAGEALVREVSAGNSYLSSHSATAHFGLGGATTLDSLSVQWPGGQVQTYYQLPANVSYRAVENQGLFVLQRRVTLSCDAPLPGQSLVRTDTIAGSANLDTLRLFSIITDEFSAECVLSTDDVPSLTNELSVYPNPFTETITVQNNGQTPQHCRLRLLNYLGQEIATSEVILLPNSRQTVQFETKLASGGYLLELHYDSERVVQKLWKTD